MSDETGINKRPQPWNPEAEHTSIISLETTPAQSPLRGVGSGSTYTAPPLVSFAPPSLEAAAEASSTTAPFEQSCERSIDFKMMMKFGSSLPTTSSPLYYNADAPSFAQQPQTLTATTPTTNTSVHTNVTAAPFVPAAAFRLSQADGGAFDNNSRSQQSGGLAVSGTGSKTSDAESAGYRPPRLKRRSQAGVVCTTAPASPQCVSHSQGASFAIPQPTLSSNSTIDRISNEDPLQLGLPAQIKPIKPRRKFSNASGGGSSTDSFGHHEADEPYVADSPYNAGGDLSSNANNYSGQYLSDGGSQQLLGSHQLLGSQQLLGSGTYDNFSQQNNISATNPLQMSGALHSNSSNHQAYMPVGNLSPAPQQSAQNLGGGSSGWLPVASLGSNNTNSMSVGRESNTSTNAVLPRQAFSAPVAARTSPSPFTSGGGDDDDQFMVTGSNSQLVRSPGVPTRMDSGTPPSLPLLRGQSSGNFSSGSGDSFAHLALGTGGYVHPMHFTSTGIVSQPQQSTNAINISAMSFVPALQHHQQVSPMQHQNSNNSNKTAASSTAPSTSPISTNIDFTNGSIATQHFLRQTGGVLGNNRYESLEVQAHKAASAELVAACLYAGTARYNFTVEAPRGLVKLYPPETVAVDTEEFAGSSRATETASQVGEVIAIAPASATLSEAQQREYLEGQAANIAMTAGGTTALPLPSVPVTMVSVSRHIVSHFMQKPQDRLSWSERKKRLEGLNQGWVKKRPIFGVDPTPVDTNFLSADYEFPLSGAGSKHVSRTSSGSLSSPTDRNGKRNHNNTNGSRPISPAQSSRSNGSNQHRPPVYIEADPSPDIARVIVPARYIMDEDDLTLSTVHDRNATETALRRWEQQYGPLCEPTVGFMRYKSQLWWLRKRFEVEALTDHPLPPTSPPPPTATHGSRIGGSIPDPSSSASQHQAATMAAARASADLSASGTLSFSVAVCASFNVHGKCPYGSQCEMVHIRWGTLMRYVEHTAEKTFRNSGGNENVILTAAKTRVPPLIMCVDAHLHPFLTRRKGKLPYVRALPAHMAEAMDRLHRHFGVSLPLYEDPSAAAQSALYLRSSKEANKSSKPPLLHEVHIEESEYGVAGGPSPKAGTAKFGGGPSLSFNTMPNNSIVSATIPEVNVEIEGASSTTSQPPTYKEMWGVDNDTTSEHSRQISNEAIAGTIVSEAWGMDSNAAGPDDGQDAVSNPLHMDPSTGIYSETSGALEYGDSMHAVGGNDSLKALSCVDSKHKDNTSEPPASPSDDDSRTMAPPLGKSHDSNDETNTSGGNWSAAEASEITSLKSQRSLMVRYPRDVESNRLNFVNITAYVPSGIEAANNRRGGGGGGGGGGGKNDQRQRSRQVQCPVEDIILTKGARLVLERKPGAPVKPLLCSHFEQGLCTRGTACMFIHYYNSETPHPLSASPHLHITEDDDRYDYLTQNQRTGDPSPKPAEELTSDQGFNLADGQAGSAIYPSAGNLTTSASLIEDYSASAFLPPTNVLPSDLTTLLSTAGSGYSRQQQIRQITGGSNAGGGGSAPSWVVGGGNGGGGAGGKQNHNNNSKQNHNQQHQHQVPGNWQPPTMGMMGGMPFSPYQQQVHPQAVPFQGGGSFMPQQQGGGGHRHQQAPTNGGGIPVMFNATGGMMFPMQQGGGAPQFNPHQQQHQQRGGGGGRPNSQPPQQQFMMSGGDMQQMMYMQHQQQQYAQFAGGFQPQQHFMPQHHQQHFNGSAQPFNPQQAGGMYFMPQ